MTKIVIDSKYFGDEEALNRFLEESLQEIEKIENGGKKHSKMPERFLSDVYPRLFSLQVIFENLLKERSQLLEEQIYQIGGSKS